MKMKFGKFKGYDLEDIPDNYLLWLNFQTDSLNDNVLENTQKEIHRRWPDRCPVRYVRGSLTGSITDKAKRIYRELAVMFHPDHGGNTEAMKAVNLFYERMKA